MVQLPEGYYHETRVGLRVQTIGGALEVARTWYQGEWHSNRVWNALQLDRDPRQGTEGLKK